MYLDDDPNRSREAKLFVAYGKFLPWRSPRFPFCRESTTVLRYRTFRLAFAATLAYLEKKVAVS
jgi:hypothetical protein